MYNYFWLLFIILIIIVLILILLIQNLNETKKILSQQSGQVPVEEDGGVVEPFGFKNKIGTFGQSSHLVFLVPGSTNEDISFITNKYNITIERTFLNGLKGFMAILNKGQIKKLKKDKKVLRVEKDEQINAIPIKRGKKTSSGQTIDWWVPRIGSNYSSTVSGNGSGDVDVDIYILDTGVDPKHKDINVVGGKSFISSEKDYKDGNGHGTHVAGLAAARDNASHTVGAAPGARIHAIKVLSRTGSGSYSSVISGINYVIGEKGRSPTKPMVINLSLGGYVGTSSYNSIDLAVQEAINAGIVVCIAAGNSGDNATLYSPAHVQEAITVGAFDRNNNFASFSNHGPVVDICSPGVGILSSYLRNRLETLSGTSMASPIVCGTVALYLSQNPRMTPAQVKTAILYAAQNPLSYQNNDPLTNPLVMNVPSGTTNLSLFCGNF